MAPSTDSSARLDTFAQMSMALTGFTKDAIAPDLDPLNLKQVYLDAADARATAPVVDLLLARFTAIKTYPPQQIADTLLGIDPPAAGATVALARSLVKLWYLGSWYNAGDTAFDGKTVSADAYIGALVWRVMQAHAMGYSEFTFGYWSAPPPPLSDFGANVPGAKS